MKGTLNNMILYIKQKIFSFTDSYNVYDESLQAIYKVDSEFLAFLSKIHLCDLYGNELFFIKKKLTFILAEYEIYKGDTLYAEVKKEFSFFNPRLTVTSPFGGYQIEGNFFAMDFSIFCDGILLGTISKEWLSFGDSYKLDIADANNAAFFTALVIAIDNCIHNEKRS
jgi:uncharacterized protein YxjI